MATHCSILARRFPWTEKPGRQRVRHDYSNLATKQLPITQPPQSPNPGHVIPKFINLGKNDWIHVPSQMALGFGDTGLTE